MADLFNWVEIPVTDMARAKKFYESLLSVEMQPFAINGTNYAVFPSTDFSGHGALVEGVGYAPSTDGPLVYLDATGKLDELARQVPMLGGDVVLPCTYISEEGGEIVHFRDTEGNRLGLHSPVTRPSTGAVTDQTMHRLLESRKPSFAFVVTRGPRFEDPELASLQWEHARNMFALMRDGKLIHVSALADGASILGFGVMEADSREEVAAILAADPGVAAGRLAFEVTTAVSFDGEKTRHRL